jgi:hypothetical protein
MVDAVSARRLGRLEGEAFVRASAETGWAVLGARVEGAGPRNLPDNLPVERIIEPVAILRAVAVNSGPMPLMASNIDAGAGVATC